MTKWSNVNPNNAPALGDFLMGVTAGNVDDRVMISTLKSLILPNQTRRVIMQMGAEETGGATSYNNYGREVQFASGANPTGFARCAARVPKDYVAGTSINLIAFCIPGATQTMPMTYYIEGLNVGDDGVTSPWNVASNLNTGNVAFTAKLATEVTIANIPSGSVSANKFFGMAVKPNAVLSGIFEIVSVVMEYTATF